MWYKGYEIYLEDNQITLANIQDFEPEHIFECGQCFRWVKEKEGCYIGVVEGRVLHVSKIGGDLVLKNTNLADFKNIWFDYFDLGRDYSAIKERIAIDPHMQAAVEFGHGIRILKQNFYEMLLSFILSTNNNIPRITGIIEALAKLAGQRIRFGDRDYYAFPRIAALSQISPEDIQQTRMGYRARYITQTVQSLMAKQPNLKRLQCLPTHETKNELMQYHGVGSKVADCVMLFSGLKSDVFPVDVWVKRVMEELYLKKETDIPSIHGFAMDYFAEDCGFAQQYLFYYARKNRMGNLK